MNCVQEQLKISAVRLPAQKFKVIFQYSIEQIHWHVLSYLRRQRREILEKRQKDYQVENTKNSLQKCMGLNINEVKAMHK